MSDRKVRRAKGAERQGRASKNAKGGRKNVGGRGAAGRRGGGKGDIGRALRSVYDETLREDIPDDFLDLLGKLR